MKIHGTAILEGIAIGKFCYHRKTDTQIEKKTIQDPKEEIQRFKNSVEEAKTQLDKLHKEAMDRVSKKDASIFEIHQIMLDDLDFHENVENLITDERVNAEYAVDVVRNKFIEQFLAMDSDYMKARADDISDICERVIGNLKEKKDNTLNIEDKVIVIADDLLPSEAIQLDKSKVISFVTRFGSSNSHTSIIARSMGIPAIVGADFPQDVDGKTGIVDGYNGIVYIDPDKEILEKYKKLEEEYLEKLKVLDSLKGKETKTKNGKKIKLYANISGIDDVQTALDNDAEGIGLYRSELVFLESDHLPTEEEQFVKYKEVVQGMKGKQVIIRTMDIGADKKVDYLNLPQEENPALGCRAIRVCLENPKLFKTQLRAIIRATCYGNVGIMYPMVISLNEVFKIKQIVSEVLKELDEEQIPYGTFEQGIMIETPAAVLIAEDLAKEMDFFSIGTNDLTQYLLAIDRQNSRLDNFLDIYHPAILKAIKMTIDGGHKYGAWVGICGELAGDSKIVETLVDMGVDELSVSSARVLPIKQIILNL